MSGCTVDTPEGRCGRPLEGRGMCSGHYQWASGHGWERPTHALRLRRPKDAVCQIDTHEGRCGRGPVVGRDMCDGHYAWSRKRGWEVPTHALRFRSRGTRRERTTKREPRLFPQRSGLSIPRSIKPSDLPCMTDVEMDLWSEANAVLEVPGSPCNDCTLAFAAEMQGLGLCRYMAATKQLCLYITIVLTLVFARPRLWDRPPSETTAPGFVRDTPR